MVEITGSNANGAPTTVAQLSLPPTFIADHCLRTLFYQRPLSPVELARHWHVHADICFEVVESLKADGVVQTDGVHTNFELHGRVDLTALGRERVATARERTWYAGPMPVSVTEFTRRVETSRSAAISRAAIRDALGAHHIDETIADEIGEAISGGAIVSVAGLTAEEQPAIAASIGRVLPGDLLLPYALYAAGAVIRVFDGRYHRIVDGNADAADETNILRSSEGEQWARIAKPAVTLKGGMVASDLLPAYDEEAKFYIAPAPLAACGGMLAVLHTDLAGHDALATFARLWLVPGRARTGVLLLRSGERVELPWHTSTLLLSSAPLSLSPAIRSCLPLYSIDASVLGPQALRAFLADRLGGVGVSDTLLQFAAERLERASAQTRNMASAFAEHVRNRAAFEADEFRPTPAMIEEAVEFAGRAWTPAEPRLRLAA